MRRHSCPSAVTPTRPARPHADAFESPVDPFTSAPRIDRTPPRRLARAGFLTSIPHFAEIGCQTGCLEDEDVMLDAYPKASRLSRCNALSKSLLPQVIKALVVNLLLLPWLPHQATDSFLAALSPAVAYNDATVGAGWALQPQNDCQSELDSCTSMLSELRLSREEPLIPSWCTAPDAEFDIDQVSEMPGNVSATEIAQFPEDSSHELDMQLPKPEQATDPTQTPMVVRSLFSPGSAALATASAIIGFRGIAR